MQKVTPNPLYKNHGKHSASEYQKEQEPTVHPLTPFAQFSSGGINTTKESLLRVEIDGLWHAFKKVHVYDPVKPSFIRLSLNAEIA